MISTHFVSIHSKVGCCRVPGIINFAPLYPLRTYLALCGWLWLAIFYWLQLFPYLIFVLTLPILLWKEICEELKLQVANDHQLKLYIWQERTHFKTNHFLAFYKPPGPWYLPLFGQMCWACLPHLPLAIFHLKKTFCWRFFVTKKFLAKSRFWQK